MKSKKELHQIHKSYIVNHINSIFMKTQFYLILIIVAAVLLSCSGGSNKEATMDGGYLNDMTTAPLKSDMSEKRALKNEQSEITNEPKEPETEKIGKKIIKTASVNVEVDDYDNSMKHINSVLKEYNAYVSSENENRYDSQVSNTIVIRVPNENFDTLLVKLVEGSKQVNSKTVSVNDVTEEYVDVYTRLKNKREVEKQYVELLKKANTVGDILDVNEHLRRLTEEIEAKEGRLKYIDNRVKFSTITLYIYQSFKQDYGFFGKILDALEGGWQGFLAFIVGLIYIWPLLIIALIVFLLIRKAVKKRKKAKQKDKKLTN